MRASEFIFESDNRNRIAKLVDMIQHPSTEDTIRRVAAGKLKLILDKEEPLPEPEELYLPETPHVSTNIKQEYMNAIFINNMSFGECLQNLSLLSPPPTRVEFMRQGQIAMLVKPPFHGQTRADYFRQIENRVPGIRRISADYQMDQGYSILLSWI